MKFLIAQNYFDRNLFDSAHSISKAEFIIIAAKIRNRP